jgi:N-acetylneuraminic acid mutarotase
MLPPHGSDERDGPSSSSDAPHGLDGGEALQWQAVHYASPSPGSRVFPSAVVHEDSLYIFGGHDGGIYRNDLLVFNLETHAWDLSIESSGGPSPRDAHAAVVQDECMYVFGGYDSKRYLNDFHRFRFTTSGWELVSSSGGAPSPRGGHTAAVVHTAEMLVFGGCDGWNYFNDLYKFTFDSLDWLPVRVTGTAPGARSAPATVVHEAQAMMYVFGGYDGGRSLNDLFRFSLGSSEWAQVRTHGIPPSPRGGHTAVVHGSTLYAFGGKSGRSPFNDLHSFSFDTSRWEQAKAESVAPAPRCAHTCVVHASSLYVFGGYDGRRYFDDCFELPLQPPMRDEMESSIDNPQFSDVSFEVEGRVVHAHKVILSARSEYFRLMFTSGCREEFTKASIPIPDVRYDVFRCVLAFLYTGKARDVEPAMAVEVLGVANLYAIDPLKRVCADVIMRSLCVQNVAAILQAADTYGVAHLRAHCLAFMVEHFGEVVRSDGFRELVSRESRPLVLAFLDEASRRMVKQPSECERAEI